MSMVGVFVCDGIPLAISVHFVANKMYGMNEFINYKILVLLHLIKLSFSCLLLAASVLGAG